MTAGPGGAYDAHCQHLLLKTHARTAAVIVINGDLGSGFSVACGKIDDLRSLADVLEQVAAQIRADLKGLEH